MQTNLEYYKIFYYVSKYNSISLAAEALSISQPAVSQAVKHLESDLSCALLPYLEAFHDAFPQIKVTVTNAPTPETLKHLQDGKIDFGIISTPVNNKYDFKMTPVRKIQDVFVAGKKFEYLKGGKLSYKELENLPVMCLEGSTSTRKYVEDYLAERGTFVRPEFELATSDMLIQFAVRNLGVASVVSDFAEKYIENGELFVLKFDRAIPEREFCIVSNERAPMSAAAEKLYDFLLVP